MKKPYVFLLALALLTAGGAGVDLRVMAWGNEGHEIVCAIAYKLLSTADRHEVDRLVRLYRTPDNRGYNFFTAACTFPDRARRLAGSDNETIAKQWQHFKQFDRWHFLNLPRTARTIPDSACGNDCVLHGIEHHVGQLRNHSLPDPERSEALMFLGHWVGDVHQPLHVSYADDRGGNLVEIKSGGFYAPIGDLHAVWDSGIIGKTLGNRDWWTYAGELRSGITPQLQQQWSAVPQKDWAQESYDIGTQPEALYCHIDDKECRSIPGKRTLTADYQKAFADAVTLRLQKAGARLATLIQGALHE